MVHIYTTIKNSYIFKFIGLALLTSLTSNAQTWESLGNPIVNGEAVTSIITIESYDGVVYLCTNKGLFASYNDGDSFLNLTWASGITQGQMIRCIYKEEITGNLYIGGNTAVYKSMDDGTSWNATTINNVAVVNDIQETANNIVVAYGETNLNGGVLYSSDGLVSTNQSTSIPTLQMLDLEIYNNTLYLAGKDAVYKSVDEGNNWDVAGTGHPANGKYIKMLSDGNTLFAADIFGNGLFKSTDESLTWSNANTTTFNGFCQVFDVTAANGTIMVVVDGACNGSEPIKYSQDNGVTWNSGLFNISNAFYSELGRNSDGTCLFVYTNGTLYRTCDLTLSILDNNLQEVILYPNPSKESFYVKGIMSGELDIYNLQGQLIKKATVANSQTPVDISELRAGLYVITLRTFDEIKTFKLMISK